MAKKRYCETLNSMQRGKAIILSKTNLELEGVGIRKEAEIEKLEDRHAGVIISAFNTKLFLDKNAAKKIKIKPI